MTLFLRRTSPYYHGHLSRFNTLAEDTLADFFAPRFNNWKNLLAETIPTTQTRSKATETDEAWTFQFEVPGVKQENVNVTLDESAESHGVRVLRVSGEQTSTTDSNLKGSSQSTSTSSRKVSYQYALPANRVDDGGIRATLENGILQVSVAKAVPQTPRSIKVVVNSPSPTHPTVASTAETAQTETASGVQASTGESSNVGDTKSD